MAHPAQENLRRQKRWPPPFLPLALTNTVWPGRTRIPSVSHTVYPVSWALRQAMSAMTTSLSFDAVVQNPYTVFIFDEIEKAAPQVLKVLMAVLDEGRCAAVRELPDHSREYKFHKSIFIFTSNMLLHGSEERRQKIGFAVPKAEEVREHEDGIEVIYKAPAPEQQKDSLTGRIYHDNEVARKSFIAQGNLAEIASRFQCFLEFRELDDGAKIRILVKQVLESAAEYGIKIHHIDTGIMQELINICSAEQSLTVRSFRPVIEELSGPRLFRSLRRFPGGIRAALRNTGRAPAPVDLAAARERSLASSGARTPQALRRAHAGPVAVCGGEKNRAAFAG